MSELTKEALMVEVERLRGALHELVICSQHKISGVLGNQSLSHQLGLQKRFDEAHKSAEVTISSPSPSSEVVRGLVEALDKVRSLDYTYDGIYKIADDAIKAYRKAVGGGE